MYRFTKKQKNTKKPADSREKKEEKKRQENIEIVQNTASHAGAVTGEKE